MSHHHHENHTPSQRNIFLSIALNLLITIAEFTGGIFANSLALVSDALHNLSDTFAIALSYVALKAGQKSSNYKNTFGYKRIEILAALFNSVTLIAICIFLFYEAYNRFIHPQPVVEKVMMIVAVISLIANLAAALLLHRDAEHNLNIKTAYIHLLGDTLSSLGVIIGAALIHFYKIYWIDPLLTVLIGIFIIKQTIDILRETIEILMQATPDDFNIDNIKIELEKNNQILNIHHVHAWRLNDTSNHFECHVDLKENLHAAEIDLIRKQLELVLINQFNIHHVTIQMEYNCCDNKNVVDV